MTALTAAEAALCRSCGHRAIEHDAVGQRPCRKLACGCRRWADLPPPASDGYVL